MMNLKKGSALLIVGMMIMSGLVAFLSAPVLADDTTTITAGSGETYTAGFVTGNMVDHPEIVLDADEPIVINEQGSGAANRLIYLGDEITVQCGIWTSHAGDPGYDIRVEAYSDDPLITIGDDDGDSFLTGAWADPITVAFDIIVGNAGTVEAAYDMHFRVTEDPGGADDAGNIPFQIYVSSLWHDDNTDVTRDSAHEFAALYDEDDDDALEAGDRFADLRNSETNDADFTITDPEATLVAPDDDTNDGDTDGDGIDDDIELYGENAKFVGEVTAGSALELMWRADVEPQARPGTEFNGLYDGTILYTYERTVAGVDKTIVENARIIWFQVDFSFKDDDSMPDGQLFSEHQIHCIGVELLEETTNTAVIGNGSRQLEPASESITIDQSVFSDKMIRIRVSFVNNGNTPIYQLSMRLWIEETGWDYFINPLFFYDQNIGPLTHNDPIQTNFVQVINPGDTFNVTIEVFVAKNIPIGEHRLPIKYDGFYFDDGSLGGSTQYIAMLGGDGDPNDATDLEVYFSIFVEDGVMDAVVTAVGMVTADKGDITSEVITVTIVNNEAYDYIDVIVVANFAGTPFYAPLINTATLDWPTQAERNYVVEAQNANPATPYGTRAAPWAGGGNMVLTFLVDTDPNMVPDRYPFSLTILAIIENNLVQVQSTITAGAELNYAGYGAMPVITAFTADDIIPGQNFDLVLTIENVGDDTLRDVWIEIPPDGTDEYDWDVEAEFKEQFMWGGDANYDLSHIFDYTEVHWNTDFPSDMFYTMESLDVDNVREIIEINLYMEGVYSDPGSTIQVIHIIDLAPGASFDVTFEMFADKDMVNGKPYNVEVIITGIDSEGANAGRTQILEVWSSLPGDSYNPVELDWFDAGLKLLFLVLFFIIVLALLLLVYNKFKGEPLDEDEDEFDFEDDEPASFEEPEAPATETKAPEELVQP